MTAVRLQSPITGWTTPLTDVPDEAFAQGLIGDGLAVDPFEMDLCAPCDGTVVTIHRAKHACTIRAANGAEILMHIGVDTVELGGDGFETFVSDGQAVRAGDKLISFDMDKVATAARSLQVIMVVANGDGYPIEDRVLNCEVKSGDFIMAVEGEAVEASSSVSSDADEVATKDVRLMIASGLHARPAAALANAAREFFGSVTIELNGKSADAKSVVSLMALGTAYGDTLAVTVRGPGAGETLEKLTAAIAAGLGDPVFEDEQAVPAAAAKKATLSSTPIQLADDLPPFEPGQEEVLADGTTAVQGVAVGAAVRLFHAAHQFSEYAEDAGSEKQRFEQAMAVMNDRLATAAKGEGHASEIFEAHRTLLSEPELASGTLDLISNGKSAEWAWTNVVGKMVAVLEGLADSRMSERAADLRDLEAQVLGILTGHDPRATLADFPEGGILVADEVLPSELTAVPRGRLAGICMAAGGKTSHAVILAESMGIPTIVAAGPHVVRVPEGAPVIIDGPTGAMRVFSSEETQQKTRDAAAKRVKQRELNRKTAHEICYTADGVRIEVFANLGKVDDATVAMAEGAEGCGLLRSEFLYLGRASAPTEDEQFQEYQAIADAMQGRPVIIRTLDAGGDKPLAYFPIPEEENPALGVRGVRATLKEPELLRTQLRAILRVRPYGIAKIMVPMVTSVTELRAVKAMIEEERVALGRDEPIEVGAMIEVPAAALTSAQLAEEAAFFSIGTNDLTQYGLAMDRGNPALAPSIDALHPGVLRLIEQVAIGAAKNERTVAVCGGAASDVAAVPFLIGLGVTELSATPAVIADVKALIRTLNMADCRALAQSAVTAETSKDVRALVADTGA
ncbi:phosphoenolpyruvate--protein phosphotransferase [Pseudovibrio sp. SPO723]|uniref:phosphoenolpyruvate--protein phosphotransferase n=1 Tax=Nesiotobacter zosterae TaxID=392721 RepID=UPI0029C20A9A|nr:phosphoenolpyruvate--protein phosphotransferase [Pseudovibrio sp. SPO723]MDX5594799.1 phosphoenolpyruvate--protein phosphotransferase [Pseudovibrio sp. SPO723]